MPNIWGGEAFGNVIGSPGGQLFSFSGMDGESDLAHGFYGVFENRRYALNFCTRQTDSKYGLKHCHAAQRSLIVQLPGNNDGKNDSIILAIGDAFVIVRKHNISTATTFSRLSMVWKTSHLLVGAIHSQYKANITLDVTGLRNVNGCYLSSLDNAGHPVDVLPISPQNLSGAWINIDSDKGNFTANMMHYPSGRITATCKQWIKNTSFSGNSYQNVVLEKAEGWMINATSLYLVFNSETKNNRTGILSNSNHTITWERKNWDPIGFTQIFQRKNASIIAVDNIALVLQTNKYQPGTVPSVQKFAIAFSTSPNIACQTAKSSLNIDVNQTITQRTNAYSKLPLLKHKNKKLQLNSTYIRLMFKAFSVMKVNTFSAEGQLNQSFSIPDVSHHREIDLWDSVFHSLGMNKVDPVLSYYFLLSLLKGEQNKYPPYDMLPIASYPDGTNRGKEETQPPLVAWAIWKNYLIHKNISMLQQSFPLLETYLNWNLVHRDQNKNGLLEWASKGESGWDNSQRFDSNEIMDAADFSIQQANDMAHLSKIAKELGEDTKAEIWAARASNTSKIIHLLLWNPELQFYCDLYHNGSWSNIITPAGLMALMLPDLPPVRAKILNATIYNPTVFGTPAGLPTVSRNYPSFSTDMWRGAMWPNINVLIIEGLRVQKLHATSKDLALRTLNVILKWYEKFGTVFEFYDADDKTPPTKILRKKGGACGAVRDYHWSAASTMKLIYEYMIV